MNQSREETNLLRVLVGLPILQIFSIIFVHPTAEAALGIDVPLTHSFWLTLATPLFLLVYTSIPWWYRRMGRAYLPVFLGVASVYTILDKYFTLAWFIPPAQQELGNVMLTLKLWVNVSTISLLVAWQYSRKWVLFVSLALFIADGALSMPFLRFGTVLSSFTFALSLFRLVFVTSVAVGVQWLVNHQRQQSAALAAANLKLVQYATTTEQLAASQERNRLARELHDTLAHSLSGVAVQLQAVQALWELKPEQARHNLDRALQATQSGLTEARRALQALRASPLEDLGLAFAVSNLAKSTAVRANLRLELNIQHHLRALEPQVEQCIYRVAQEALSNVSRHAQASSISVFLGIKEEILTLSIMDDGRGFDVGRVNGVHFGLRGLRERAELIGARLQVTSALQAGTTVCLLVPNEENS